MITCSLIYTPAENVGRRDLDFGCWDKKIHIKFKDYNREQVICGFEHKLTYLLSYLFHFNYYKAKDMANKSAKAILDDFTHTADVQKIVETIHQLTIESDIVGIKISKRRDSNSFDKYGRIELSAFPMLSENGFQNANLQQFLNSFHIQLADYLFNDQYSIKIHKYKETDPESKFINKQLKRENKINSDISKLW